MCDGSDMSELILRRSGRQRYGVEELNLFRRDAQALTCYSGAAGRQNFRRKSDEVAGRLEPIPEGVYSLGPLEWAGKPGDYDTSWSSALGPVWVTIEPVRSIGFHLDANAIWSFGSAGCVVFPDEPTLRQFVSWWDDDPPTTLTVDWGLGTIAAEHPATSTRWTKIFLNNGKTAAIDRGESVPSLIVAVRREATGALHVVKNGKELKAKNVTLLVEEAT